VREVARAPFTRRAWAELAYCLIGFPLGLLGFVVIVLSLALGTGLAATLVGTALGLLLLVGALATARGLGVVHRRLAHWLLGLRVPEPGALRPGRGALGRLGARLRDGTAWRIAAIIAVGRSFSGSARVAARRRVPPPTRDRPRQQRPPRLKRRAAPSSTCPRTFASRRRA
jgi:putative sensor protein